MEDPVKDVTIDAKEEVAQPPMQISYEELDGVTQDACFLDDDRHQSSPPSDELASARNQAQKDDETAQNYEKGNSGQAEPETANAEKSRDNSILSHEPERNSAESSIQIPLVTESASKSTRPREWRFLKNYPEEFVIGDVSHGVQTRSSTRKANEGSNIALLSQMEPQNVKEALSDPSWIKAMEDELLEFEKNQVWTLVPRPSGKKVTGTKWIFRNKLGEDGMRQFWAGDERFLLVRVIWACFK
ncbi:uncharacterized protein LOC130934493 [Arachis stenosperma]|uniref:uncharacterized protein LOC130934493 n=1 Tax=Arachis stenosperma TaxID=217475 RepID=UPI0025AC1787|nr:uncharacterized protein LOC130934493 [Arachis stenosperma]